MASRLLAHKRLGRSSHSRKVEVLVGSALETLRNVTGPFDLIFIDADMQNDVRYSHRALELLAPSGMLLVDNTQGMVLAPVDPGQDPAIAAIQELARLTESAPRISAGLMRVCDGVLVITRADQAV